MVPLHFCLYLCNHHDCVLHVVASVARSTETKMRASKLVDDLAVLETIDEVGISVYVCVMADYVVNRADNLLY